MNEERRVTTTRRALTTTRRRVLKGLAALGIGGPAVAHAANERLAGEAPLWPEMTYRTLGRTGFRGSRLVFGCGAALALWEKDDLLQQAFDHGINVFDVGTSDYYMNAESNLASFARKHRDEIFLISKGLVGIETAPGDELSKEQRRQAASNWSSALDKSLTDLGMEHVDAYYIMAANNVSLVRSDEMREAFLRAKSAGKVDHWGISTHENAQAVLQAAAATDGWYALAQIAVTPAGWYDWGNKGVLTGSRPMAGLRPVFEQARRAGIGLIGMKAARHLAGPWMGFGPDRPTAFDAYYNGKLRAAELSPFQRSYAYVLAHGLDAVNADSQSIEHLHENFIAAATSEQFLA